MEKQQKHGFNPKAAILSALVVMVAVGVLGSVGLAAQAQSAAATSAAQVTMLDPFALRMVTLANASASSQTAALSARLATSVTWRPVRIPSRLPERSAFRPDYTGR